jgi:predicted HTH transcriptional regulator
MPDYPERALLEGIVNALIHRNYLELGSEVHVDMFDDRLEIYSPGGMCDGTKVQDRDLMRVPSRRRNPIIADIFNRLKYMDRRGSGFKKILSDYSTQPNYDEHLRPQFYSDNDSFVLVLKNINYRSSKNEGKRRVFKRTTEHIEKIEKYLKKHGGSRTKDIAVFIQLSDARTRAILSEMDNVIATGENSARRYWLKEQ